MQTISALGSWNWLILAALLLALEVTLPGVFFMWFGLAAAVTALIAFAFDVSWQWQFVWFGLLSLTAVAVALKYLRQHPLTSDRPLLNERAVQHIGQSYKLVDPIVNGRGSVKIGDSIWRVEGPDLPKGTRVRVLATDGTVLKVAPDSAGAA
jgi:membrane protein implicated in regulation of membrane protease activity